MIVPWLRGVLGFSDAPLTWTLIGLNLLFFFLTAGVPQSSDGISLTKKDLQWAGRLHARFHGDEIPKDPMELYLRGNRALRDRAFLDQISNLEAPADVIGFEQWKSNMRQFQQELSQRPVDIFGLHADQTRPLSWLTYQFMHSGAWHLLGNLIMFLLFGSALEKLMGSWIVASVYLVGGVCGAWMFLWLTPLTTAPMVGASASLSAIMAFYALVEKKKRVKYFFFLSPAPGFWGEIYLPTLLIVPLYFVEDLASYLGTAQEIGAGIAYTAHMGGAAFGFLLAITVRLVCRHFPQWEQTLYASYSPSRSEAP